jgi:hypothetical protein
MKMKQGTLLALILFAMYGNAYCDDTIYVVTQDTRLSVEQNNMIKSEIKKGETVLFRWKARDVDIVSFDPIITEPEILVKTEKGESGWIWAKHILLQNSFALPAAITEKNWVYSFYQQVIMKSEKEVLFDYVPFWRLGIAVL